jgi:hypothetical protein
MTKATLHLAQRRTVEIIERLGFGVIQGLHIRKGQPCDDPAPKIVQSIKLDSAPERQLDCSCTDLTLAREFESLFDYLSRLGDGTVDVEVRHSLPARLVLERRYEEFER